MGGHGDASPVEGQESVARVLDPPQTPEFAGTVAAPPEGPQELAARGEHPHFLRAPVGNHERPIRALLHVAEPMELVAGASARDCEVHERIRIEAPETRVAPERPHGLDDLDAGAVAPHDEGRAGLAALTGCQKGQEDEEKRSGHGVAYGWTIR